MEYRFLSAMQGSLGIGANLNKFTLDDFAQAKKFVEEYKSIRQTVQRGSLYRLILPTEGSEHSATEYVGRDGKQAVVFAFLHSSTEYFPYPTLKLRGLDPAAMYKVNAVNGKIAKETPAQASGAYWMNHGVDVLLQGDFQAAELELNRQ
jgi:alpha-galactosidase